MIAFVLFFTVAILFAVEILSRREELRSLRVSFSLDTRLVEPGEIVTLRYTVSNPGVLPLLYGGFTLRLDPVFTVEEEEAFLRRRAKTDFTGTRINYHFYLGPRRQFTGKLRLSLQKRGLHELGRYYLDVGDFLGLKPTLRTGDIPGRVICTAAPCDTPRMRVLGGELGPVSLRRFIQDDPTMILGYRDYTGREPMKQISWNQSAKAGRLIVRQQDFTTDRKAAVIVNIDPAYPRLLERCLSLTGSVCRLLEKEKIPYALESNGDLFSLREGLGPGHLFFIQRRIGLSMGTGYVSFQTLISQYLYQKTAGVTPIIVTPALTPPCQAAIDRLARHLDREPIVLCAQEDAS